MTRYFILSFLILATTVINNKTVNATTGRSTEIIITGHADIAHDNPAEPVKEVPALPGTQPFQPVQKTHGQTPAMDELAHIHHFHKGRVKKIRRHHEKFWVLSKILVIVCHIVLLLIAYMHVTH